MKIKKYLVTATFDRELVIIGTTDTLQEAQKLMRQDMRDTAFRNTPPDEWLNALCSERYEDDGCGIYSQSAWYNASEGDYDWEINVIEIDIPSLSPERTQQA